MTSTGYPRLPADYDTLPQADREAALMTWASEVETAAEARKGDDFTVLVEGLLHAQACTSLSDEDATERMNTVPSGTSHGWVLTTDPAVAPVACADRPDTHRHLIFDC